MNKTLYDQFVRLSATERSDLNHKFKDSPVGQRLMTFLEQCGNRNFRNTDAVSFIYADEKKKYPILENRYFKLRKKVLDELIAPERINSAQILTDEELKLYRCKNLTLADNKEEALKQLTALEAECQEKNIFELLPAILDQMIFFNQAFNRLEENKILFRKLEKAIGLQYDMNRFCMIARKIYEVNYSKGIIHAKKELAALKELATKHREYPRFLMCYHHISLYYKLGSTDYVSEMQVVSRHLSEFKRLYAQHPLMPLVSYKVNYVKHQHLHFNQSTMFYHFNRCEFEEAYQCMKEVWNLVHDEGSVFRMFQTESLYNNMFTVLCMAGRYKEANETADHFAAFLKSNGRQENLPFAYTQKARLYSELWPDARLVRMNPEFLVSQLEQYIRSAKKVSKGLFSLGEALLLRLKFHFINSESRRIKELMKNPDLIAYMDETGTHAAFSLLADLHMNESRADANELLRTAGVLLSQANSPGTLMHLRWIVEFLKRMR